MSDRHGKVQCWKCGSWVRVRLDGKMRRHRIPKRTMFDRARQPECPGGGSSGEGRELATLLKQVDSRAQRATCPLRSRP